MTSYDARFDEAEAEVDRGAPWKPEDDPDLPNPLTILAEEWVEITTDYGDTELLVGRDRDGKRWSKLVGSTILRKLLIDGIVEAWDEGENAFVQKEVLGKVQPGEVVSMKYLGKREGGKFTYSNYAVSRKAALAADEQDSAAETADQTAAQDEYDDGVPF
jgi:hypothetical protein